MVALEHQRRRLETPALRERADRRHAALRAEVKEIEREMRAIVDSDPAKKALFVCLTALKGVGLVLACTLIANMRELGSLSRHQAAALIGVAPLNHDSGTRRGYRAIPPDQVRGLKAHGSKTGVQRSYGSYDPEEDQSGLDNGLSFGLQPSRKAPSST